MTNTTAAQPLDLDRNTIREIFIRHGFTIKDGQTDLKPYVYEAAEALIAQARTARLGTTSSAVCVACEGKPSAQNNPCAVCGRATLAPVAAQQAAAKAPAAQADVFESMSMDEVIASGIKRGRQAEAADWAECERISDLPAVDEALRGFSEDPTGDNGTMIVRAVLEALAASPAIPPEASQQADDEWDRNAERLTREMGIGGGRINPDATSIDNLFIDDEDQQAAAVAAPTSEDARDADPDRCNGNGCETGCVSCMPHDAQQLAKLILADPEGGYMRISSPLEYCDDGAMRFTVTNPDTGRRFGVHLGLAELEADTLRATQQEGGNGQEKE